MSIYTYPMLPPNFILRIPQPCQASWGSMTPTGPGRHCATCAKTVVDFTQQTDAEILAYFRQMGKGKTCGRFQAEQLERPLREARATLRPTRWQGWLAGLLVAALATQSCQPTTLSEPQPHTLLPRQVVADSTTIKLDGRVVSSYTGQPVGPVRVSIVGTKLTMTTGADGLFSFIGIPKTEVSTPVTLHLVAPDCPSCDFVLDPMLPPPNQPLLVVSTSAPVPVYLMGDVEELRDKVQ